jgi:hypothetical protein
MYETLMLFDSKNHIGLAEVESAVRQRFSGQEQPTITKIDNVVKLTWPNFSLEVGVNEGESVLEESKEIAEEFAPEPLRDTIRSCGSRVEISGSDDPGMDHFNDLCFVLEAVESAGRVYTFDPGTGEFMNV